MIKTRFTELVGIEYPIMLGGMFQVGRAELAAAVSEAGGLGTITSVTQGEPENLRREIRRVKSLTKKPFAVNLSLFPSSRPIPNEAYIEVLLEEGVRIVETSGRSPEPIMKPLKDGGCIVIHKVPGVKYARTAERVGVDAVSVVGFETGGHPGMEDIGAVVLIPRTVQSVKIPVLAGGGFATGQGVAAALALGAEGVVMGTRFMAVKESIVHEKVKQWMIEADETQTTIIQKNIKSPSRVALNEVSRKVMELEQEGKGLEELLPYITGQRSKAVYFDGDIDGGVWSCGQSVGLIQDVPTAKELMERIIKEAEETVRRLGEVFNLARQFAQEG
ncbi:MAG: nitronate monooxygenase [Bacillus thermozeamaize]|jgi:nitronate monooxygenase|uniref:Probable nitronate monooxygenase n=1 Tax=Bacillus thermozeamaize TaxID=230954 RepID=A0A1Y3PTN6_9BACI|nr:MAG: nitronate monooxygenase [Bacillus thermozeamaize]